MPGKAYTVYLLSKYKHEAKLENYAMDCLREIVMNDGTKTLPRYFNYLKNTPVNNPKMDNRTGDQIVDDLIKML